MGNELQVMRLNIAICDDEKAIEIENSFDGAALFHKDSGLPISTKEDKEVHGIGHKNIRKCAVKYGGDMDCIVKENRFILSVMVKS